MSTGDFKCPYCYNYNCRDSLGRNCKDRENNPILLDPINLDPNIQYPNISYQIIKSAESWQCLGCKRHYAPHINHCDCQVKVINTWSATFDGDGYPSNKIDNSQ